MDTEPGDPAPPEVEFTCGVAVLPPLDAGLGEADGLVGALADDDALVVGVAEVVDLAACVDDEPVQLGLGLGSVLVGSAPAELELVLGLGEAGAVVVGVPVTLGLALGLGLVLGLAEALALAEALVLAEALALALALPLLWLPLDDVAGAVGLLVAPLGEVVVVTGADEFADGEVHGPGEVPAATPGEAGSVSTAVEGTGPVLWPSVVPAPVEELLMLKAELMALPTDSIAWRAGGTTDRTTPMANTATPTAKAGRSIASRQSLGCRSCPCRARPARPRRPARPAARPEMASQRRRAALGRAGRDRILSRIRSRPSAPGSTWSAAAWSSRRKNSPKSCPCPPSKPRPDPVMTPAPVPRAGRPSPARYDS